MSPNEERVSSLHDSDSLHELGRIQSTIDRSVQQAEELDALATSTWKKLWSIVYELVWPDLILSHLDWASLKIIIRSWLMMWALTLLCICGGTAEFMGPSSFLANFSAGIEIAGNLSVSSAFVYCMADELSMLFSCLCSIVTLAINWRIRGYPTEESVIKDLLAQGYCTNIPNPGFSNCIELEMHNGRFLTTKTTVVTVFGMLFSFSMCGYFQSVSKYGKLAWLLNSLYTIIVFPFNNMMPLFRPWYFARNCVVPMSMAFAARFFVSLVVFPYSSNSKVVRNMSKACSKLEEVCRHMHDLSKQLKPSLPNFSEQFAFTTTECQSIFAKFINNEVDMEMVNHLEVWFSRFEKSDLSEMRSQVRIVMSALSCFHFFYESVADQYSSIIYNGGPRKEPPPTILKYRHTAEKLGNHQLTPNFAARLLRNSWKETATYELRRKIMFQHLLHVSESQEDPDPSVNKKKSGSIDDAASTESSQRDGAYFPEQTVTPEDLDRAYSRIIEAYEPLLRTTCELLTSVSHWLSQASRVIPWMLWYRRQKCNRDYQACFEEMCKALDRHSHELATAHAKVFPSDEQFALYGYICLHFARRIKRLARWCILIHNDKPAPKLVWPFKEGSSSPSVPLTIDVDEMDYDGFHDNIDNELERTYTSFKPLSQVQARNPDSSPPRSVYHIFGMVVLKLRDFFYNGDVVFSVKRAMLVTATLTPYFCRTTCHLAYQHWFLWVAVLTAYTVARQAVDGIYGLVAKFVYNFFGCLVGMVGWYISAGSGKGNPFGYATVTAFIWLYICYQRQFNKHFIPATSVVYSCTVTLVLGNSWNSAHVALPGVELGRGFSVAWVRFVTVTIGITISFIGTIFPYSYTAKRAVRGIIGTCLEHLGDLQSSISNFGIQRYNIPGTHIIAHTDIVTRASRAIITNLNSAETLRKRLVYEPPLSGIYPTARYKLLINYVHEITLLYSLTYSFLDEVEDTAKIPQILRIMGWTDPQLTTGVYSLLYMSCRALTDGKALPSVTAATLVEQYTFEILHKNNLRPDGTSNIKDAKSDPTTMTAVALSRQVYERLDGVIMLIKELVGEVFDLNMDLFELDLEKRPLIS